MFVLSKCEVASGMRNVSMAIIPGVVVETHTQWSDSSGEDVGIQLVVIVEVRSAFEWVQMRCGEEREPVTLQLAMGKDVPHLEQGAVEQLCVESPVASEFRIDVRIWSALQRS